MNIRSIKAITLITCLLWAVTASALSTIGDEEEPLLEPSEAFATQVTLSDTNTLNVEINIAPGYFVYRSRIAVSSDQAEFSELNLPAGKIKQDQFFGEVETYRDTLKYSTKLLNTDVRGPLFN